VVAAMQAHASQAEVQEQGCLAVSNLAANCDNKTAVANAGDIRVVIAAMQTHAGHTGIQEEGCGVLFNMGRSDTRLQKCIKEQGGVGVVEAAVVALESNAPCTVQARALLRKLATV